MYHPPPLHPYSYLSILGLKALTAMPDFYINSGDPNSGLFTCVADTLPMEPSPQTSDVYVFLCVHACEHMLWHVYGGQRTTLHGSPSLPSNVPNWVPLFFASG